MVISKAPLRMPNALIARHKICKEALFEKRNKKYKED